MPRYRVTWLKIGTTDTQEFDADASCVHHAMTHAYNQFASWIGTGDRNAWMYIRIEIVSTS